MEELEWMEAPQSLDARQDSASQKKMKGTSRRSEVSKSAYAVPDEVDDDEMMHILDVMEDDDLDVIHALDF